MREGGREGGREKERVRRTERERFEIKTRVYKMQNIRGRHKSKKRIGETLVVARR